MTICPIITIESSTGKALEDQLGTLVQIMVVAQDPSYFITPSHESLLDSSNGS
jgi:hypothetical protein